MIPYSRQSIDSKDIRAVVRVLKTGRITQGPWVERFEAAFARYCGARFAVAVSSGTAGLHLACLAGGLGRGDEAITTPLTFVATANSILYARATPRFADIDDATLCLDSGKVRRQVNRKTKAVLPVHFAGQPCILPAKKKLSSRKDFMVIEDACHALGAEYQDHSGWHKVGSCRSSDMAVFSFHPVKHITTGEGGMITTNRPDLCAALRRLRSLGIERDPGRFVHKHEAQNPWYYEMTQLGFNYRITDIQCALGLSQLKKVQSFVRIRRDIAGQYHKLFRNVHFVRTPQAIARTRSSCHLYVLRLAFKELRLTRCEVMERLKKKGIGTQVHYIPVTRQPYYEKSLNGRTALYPVTDAYYESCLSIPLYPAMKSADIRKVSREINRLGSR